MKKLNIFSLLLILFSFNLSYSQELSSTVYWGSNYIYRGISNYSQGGVTSQGQSVVQGTIDYLGPNYSVSFFTSPVDSINMDTFAFEKDTEMDIFSNYMIPAGSVMLGMGYNYFSFLKNPSNNMGELNLNATWLFLRLDHSWMVNYTGLDSDLAYTKLAAKVPVSEKIFISSHLGYSNFSDNDLVLTSDHGDFKLGLGYIVDGMTVEMAYTNTIERKDFSTDKMVKSDNAMMISVSKTFSLHNFTKSP